MAASAKAILRLKESFLRLPTKTATSFGVLIRFSVAGKDHPRTQMWRLRIGRQPRKRSTFLPQPRGAGLVLRRRARRSLFAFIEITAGNAVDRRRGGEVDRCLGALRHRDRRKPLRQADAEAVEPAIVVAETARNEARVKGVRGDAGVRKTRGEHAREQDVAKLRALIGFPTAIVRGALQIGEIEHGLAMRLRGDIDDARGRGGDQPL